MVHSPGKSKPNQPMQSRMPRSSAVAAAAPPAPWDEHFMSAALQLADNAAAHGDIPVGAVVVQHKSHLPKAAGGRPADAIPVIISEGENRRQRDADPTAHAEILALKAAGEKLGRWQLADCDLYVTLEPCPMCAGALVNARIGRVIFACTDPKAGAVETLFKLTSDPRLNHRVQWTGGICAAQAAAALKKFFAPRRRKKRAG